MASIFSLPSEIITIILNSLPYTDIIRFGSTCKKFNELVKSNNMLWKGIYRKMVHPDIMRHKTGSSVEWLKMLKKYLVMKQKLTQYVEEMSSVHYNNYKAVEIGDIKHFFLIALADESSLGESIYILQEFIRQGISYLNSNHLEKPYSLTTVYYAKIVLRILFHMYLGYIWGKKFVPHKQSPVNVLSFFVQWADPLNSHPRSDVMKHLEILENVVKKEIVKRYPSKVKDDPTLENPQTLLSLTDDDVVNAISSVIYKQNYITLMPNTTLNTLDIVQVIQRHSGCVIAVGVIYHYLAKRFGLKCNLIVLPNHFILELYKRDDDSQEYKIALDTGKCQPKGRCPFSRSFVAPKNNCAYCPLSLIQYISNEFLSSMGGVRDWYSCNVAYLDELINERDREDQPIVILQKYIKTHDSRSQLTCKINYFKLQPDQLSLFRRFSCLEKFHDRKPPKRGVTVKTRSSDLKYAVGMICYHQHFHYVCLIYEWDKTCFHTRYNPTEVTTLQFGIKQPFYHVIAMDGTKRYVPQENLVEYDRPPRLFHIEDAIAKGFSHFNGFAYVPNDEKAKEYPEDLAISNFFKSKHDMQNREEHQLNS